MVELTPYTNRYLAVMRIRDLAVAHYPHCPLRPLPDLDSVALSLSDADLEDVADCSNTEVRRLVTVCLMDEMLGTAKVHRRAESVVDRVVKEVFA